MLSRTLCAVGNEETFVMANALMHADLGIMVLATMSEHDGLPEKGAVANSETLKLNSLSKKHEGKETTMKEKKQKTAFL